MWLRPHVVTVIATLIVVLRLWMLAFQAEFIFVVCHVGVTAPRNEKTRQAESAFVAASLSFSQHP